MNYLNKIKESIRILSDLGEKKLANDLLCAYAALTDSNPRVDLTYSSCMRDIRKNHKDKLKDFEINFKKAFDEALDNELDNPEQIALMQALEVTGINV